MKIKTSLLKFDYILIMVITFFGRASQFMCLPYLAIFLTKLSNLSPITIGVIVGSGPLSFSLSGFFAGYITDKIGKKISLIISLILCAISCYGISVFNLPVSYLIFNFLLGIARAGADASSSAYISDNVPHHELKLAFSVRYSLINVAAAIGPIIGMWFAATGSKLIFDISAFMYLVIAAVTYYAVRENKNHELREFPNLKQSLNILLKDQALLILTGTGVLLWIGFSQLDSTIAIYLHDTIEDSVHVYGGLFILNGIMCFVLQTPITWLSKNISYRTLNNIGSCFFIIGFIGFAFFNSPISFFINTALITLGEIILLPMNMALVAQIAPAHLRASYFGTWNMGLLGMSIGPVVGGFLLEHFGGRIMFLGLIPTFILMLILYQFLTIKEQISTQID